MFLECYASQIIIILLQSASSARHFRCLILYVLGLLLMPARHCSKVVPRIREIFGFWNPSQYYVYMVLRVCAFFFIADVACSRMVLYKLKVSAVSPKHANTVRPIPYSYSPDNIPIIQAKLAPPKQPLPQASCLSFRVACNCIHIKLSWRLCAEVLVTSTPCSILLNVRCWLSFVICCSKSFCVKLYSFFRQGLGFVRCVKSKDKSQFYVRGCVGVFFFSEL